MRWQCGIETAREAENGKIVGPREIIGIFLKKICKRSSKKFIVVITTHT